MEEWPWIFKKGASITLFNKQNQLLLMSNYLATDVRFTTFQWIWKKIDDFFK